jgi:hypothetical protein
MRASRETGVRKQRPIHSGEYGPRRGQGTTRDESSTTHRSLHGKPRRGSRVESRWGCSTSRSQAPRIQKGPRHRWRCGGQGFLVNFGLLTWRPAPCYLGKENQPPEANKERKRRKESNRRRDERNDGTRPHQREGHNKRRALNGLNVGRRWCLTRCGESHSVERSVGGVSLCVKQRLHFSTMMYAESSKFRIFSHSSVILTRFFGTIAWRWSKRAQFF